LTPLVLAAEVTDRLRVGTLVINNDFRHPLLVAREAATIDLLTDGRLELGIGAGHMKFEYDESSYAFDPAPVRIARLGEAVEMIRALWPGYPVNYLGDSYRITNHHCYPLPLQQPLPILMGGNGRRMLATAARLADIVGFTGFSQVAGEHRVNASHYT